jgi:hypothetical protein
MNNELGYKYLHTYNLAHQNLLKLRQHTPPYIYIILYIHPQLQSFKKNYTIYVTKYIKKHSVTIVREK